jgi:hypothetical protein
MAGVLSCLGHTDLYVTEVESRQFLLIVMRSIVKRLNYSSRWYTDTKSWQGGNVGSLSTFIKDDGHFPYGFFCGLVGMIGLCLLSWTMYAKHQQALAVTDCIETEVQPEISEASSQEAFDGVEVQTQVTPEEQLDRASNICELKCIRGDLSGCR